jgi:hypothetical protein
MRKPVCCRFAVVSRPVAITTVLLATTALLAGCGSDNSAASSEDVDQVGQTSVVVSGGAADPNPVTGTATPSDLNRSYAVIYQLPGASAAEVDKVLVLVPGFQGGAGTFDYLARRVVLRTNGKTVVWAMDRRSNALEDQTGLDAAEAAQDPEVAKDYYFHGKEIGGRTFAGFLDYLHDDISYMSEWGIKTHIEDLDALITEAARRYPHAAIFLGGHSLGGSIVPIYAAWDFGGRAGFERLSGLLLFEGAPNPQPIGEIPDREQYEATGTPGGFGSVSLAMLRSGDPLSSIPFVSRDLFVTTEILAMRTSSRFGKPEDLSSDQDLIKNFFGLLFGLPKIPPMSNRAALAFGFDKHFEPLAFVRSSIGQAVGPIGPNPRAALFAGALGIDPAVLLAPTDSAATYDWDPDREDGAPPPTNIDDLARALFAGPSNFIEWYFPTRLTLDVGITANLNVQPSSDWRNDAYGLAVTENSRVDLPVFAVAGGDGLVGDASRFDASRDSIAPTLRDGSARASAAGAFEAFSEPRFAHVDVLTATDSAAPDSEFSRMLSWMDGAVSLAPPPR